MMETTIGIFPDNESSFETTTAVAIPRLNNITCPDVFNANSFQLKFYFWINSCCLITVAVLGVLGNILSMLILSRPQMKSSISAVLFGLACCDTLLLIDSVMLFSFPAGEASRDGQ